MDVSQPTLRITLLASGLGALAAATWGIFHGTSTVLLWTALVGLLLVHVAAIWFGPNAAEHRHTASGPAAPPQGLILQRERENWLPQISHELRSPQSNILSLLKLHELRNPQGHDSQLHENIRRQVRRSLHLTDGLLDLLQAESPQLALQPLDMNDLAREATERCWSQAQARHITLALAPSEAGDTLVTGNGELLTRVLTHLLNNAMRHSQEGGEIRVHVSRNGNGKDVVCAVQDEGAGMASADLEQLLLQLAQSGPRQSEPPTCRPGIGLRVAHAVLQRHHGQLRARSALGAGCTFEMVLPAAPSAPLRQMAD